MLERALKLRSSPIHGQGAFHRRDAWPPHFRMPLIRPRHDAPTCDNAQFSNLAPDHFRSIPRILWPKASDRACDGFFKLESRQHDVGYMHGSFGVNELGKATISLNTIAAK